MLNEYINTLPGELKLAPFNDGTVMIMYKHEHLPITLRYYKTTNDVYLEGNAGGPPVRQTTRKDFRKGHVNK